jgi:hypothetical protein
MAKSITDWETVPVRHNVDAEGESFVIPRDGADDIHIRLRDDGRIALASDQDWILEATGKPAPKNHGTSVVWVHPS